MTSLWLCDWHSWQPGATIDAMLMDDWQLTLVLVMFGNTLLNLVIIVLLIQFLVKLTHELPRTIEQELAQVVKVLEEQARYLERLWLFQKRDGDP